VLTVASLNLISVSTARTLTERMGTISKTPMSDSLARWACAWGRVQSLRMYCIVLLFANDKVHVFSADVQHVQHCLLHPSTLGPPSEAVTITPQHGCVMQCPVDA